MLSEQEVRWILQFSKNTMSETDYERFTRLLHTCPERVSFLKNPLEYYAEGHLKERVTTGPLAGIEGYVVRINRDRKLITRFGVNTYAIDNIHKEERENVPS